MWSMVFQHWRNSNVQKQPQTNPVQMSITLPSWRHHNFLATKHAAASELTMVSTPSSAPKPRTFLRRHFSVYSPTDIDRRSDALHHQISNFSPIWSDLSRTHDVNYTCNEWTLTFGLSCPCFTVLHSIAVLLNVLHFSASVTHNIESSHVCNLTFITWWQGHGTKVKGTMRGSQNSEKEHLK